MNITEQTNTTRLKEKNNNESTEKTEKSSLAILGIVAVVIVVISAIAGWIVLKIRRWKNLLETVRKAEEGTFIGDHTALFIALIIAINVVVLVLAVRSLNKK